MPASRFHPRHWQRRSDSSQGVLNGAHRGGRSLGPENTLLTAVRGYLAGADFWELDVRLSADHVPVVVHDATLARTSNAATLFPDRAPWRTAEFGWDEIRRLDFGGGLNVGAPALIEALLLTRALDWRVNVELKDLHSERAGAALVERVVKLIQDLEMRDRVLISSFHFGYLERVRRADPALATGVLVETLPPDPAGLIAELDADALHPSAAALNPWVIHEFQAGHLPLLVWTVNEAEKMRELIAAGVTGIITDCPQALEKELSTN